MTGSGSWAERDEVGSAGPSPLAPTIRTYCSRNHLHGDEQRRGAERIRPAVRIGLRRGVDGHGPHPQDLHRLEQCLRQRSPARVVSNVPQGAERSRSQTMASADETTWVDALASASSASRRAIVSRHRGAARRRSVRHLVTALDDRRQPRATPPGSASRRLGHAGRYTPKVAPSGSRSTAARPQPGMSTGSTRTVPPPDFARPTAASTSSVPK